MTTKWIEFPDVPQFSFKDVSYTTELPALRPFYAYEPSMDGFAQAIADRKKTSIDRATLVAVLQEQYANLSRATLVDKNIQALADANSFTIITAHQPTNILIINSFQPSLLVEKTTILKRSITLIFLIIRWIGKMI